MQLKSILNRVQKHPSFVYETVRLVEHADSGANRSPIPAETDH